RPAGSPAKRALVPERAPFRGPLACTGAGLAGCREPGTTRRWWPPRSRLPPLPLSRTPWTGRGSVRARSRPPRYPRLLDPAGGALLIGLGLEAQNGRVPLADHLREEEV